MITAKYKIHFKESGESADKAFATFYFEAMLNACNQVVFKRRIVKPDNEK